ncbi:MAG: hypothetical protein HY985_13795, partial [Magnetospirillum sp.]|nr:hypothetical protein [Magnetospirillum sp.]
MTAKPVPNAYEPRTSLAWTVEGLIGSMPYSLSGEMGGGWRLSGTLTANCEIGQFIDTARRHVAGDHSGTEWFGGGTFPAFRLGMVEVAYDAARPAFSMAADLTVELAKGRPGGSLGLRFAFCRVQVAGERRTLAALTTTSPLRLSEVVSGDTGLIGQIAGGLQIERVAICYADAAFSIEDDLLGTGAKGKASFAQGLSFTAELGDGKAATPVTVIPPPEPPRPAGGDRQTTGGGKPAQAPPQGGQPCWKEVGKTYGPLHLRRIGGEWRDGKLGLLLDAAVELAGLRLDLMGLSVRLPPAKLTSLSFSDLDFSLDGLALALKRGPVAIGGGLLKTVENGQVSFVGTATIRTAAFSLSAIGSYATAPGGQASFFIYGAYGGTLGGPPAFIVQGIAAGFGYNRSLTVPPLDEVASFPLVSQVMNPDSDSGAALAKSGHF